MHAKHMKQIICILFMCMTMHVFAQYEKSTYYFDTNYVRVVAPARSQPVYKAEVWKPESKRDKSLYVWVKSSDGTLLQKYIYADRENGIFRDTIYMYNAYKHSTKISVYNTRGTLQYSVTKDSTGSKIAEYLLHAPVAQSRTFLSDSIFYSVDHQDAHNITRYYRVAGDMLLGELLYFFENKTQTLTEFDSLGNTIFEIQFDSLNNILSSTGQRSYAFLPYPIDTSGTTEALPEFPGGVNALYTYISKNINYPTEAIDAKIKGTCRLKFAVNTKGFINKIEVTQPVHPLLDFEAMRVMAASPRWEPGMLNNKPAEVWYNLPIKFSLEK